MATIDLSLARAFWFQRQGLARPPGGPIDRVIAQTGWLRTLGGVDVYLAARARSPGMRRADLDAAVADGRLRVSMAVRGCMYLVPADEVPTLLAEVTPGWRKGVERDLTKVGSSWKAIEKIAGAVVTAIGGQALSTDAIRRALPGIKSFGDAGKKAGVSSPLPIALRLLELDRKIERSPEGGRLDTERYVWRVPARPLPPASSDEHSRRRRIAEAFLSHAAPATLDHLRCWAGWSQRDARAALDGLDVTPVTVTGLGDALILSRDLDALASAAETRGVVSLLSFEDGFLVFHGGPGVVADPKHHDRLVGRWGAAGTIRLGDVAHIASRTVVIDGVVAGMWEVDPASGGGVWQTFAPLPPALADKVAATVDETARFLLSELGHARAFSLDTMGLVQDRADAIRSGKATGTKAAASAMRPGKPPARTKKTTRVAAAAKKAKKPAAKRR